MNKLETVLTVTWMTILLLLTVGWFMNVYKLFTNNDFEAPWKPEIVRGISFFAAPVAGVVGYINFNGEK